MRLEQNQQFAGYRVLRQLGRGGMGFVYLAEEADQSRRVALKLLPEELTGDVSSEARFLQEARTVMGLEHPNIVPLYRHGIERGVPWMALRYVEGGDLSERLSRPLTIAEGLACLRQIALALDFAHKMQVVHRDLKPQNVLLSEDGHVYLADFGIAKLLTGEGIRTSTGGILGTPQYMAPEYARGGEPGPAADIYALGVIAFQWQTGCLPFNADTPQAVLLQQVLDPIPDELLNRLSPRLAGVLRRVLDKDPARRHHSASSFVDDLAAALSATTASADLPSVIPAKTQQLVLDRPAAVIEANRPLPAIHRGRSGHHWRWIALATLPITALIGISLISLDNRGGLSEPTAKRPPTPPAPESPMTPAADPSEPSPDGAMIVGLGDPLPSAGQVFRERLRTGGIGPEMVVLNAGRFLMGSAEQELIRDDEGPQREVTIRAFAMGVTELTFADWDECVKQGGCPERPDPEGWGRENRPVIGVSWEDAQRYSEWLTQETGREHRLPSEAEWEYAARAGTGTAYWWGKGIDRSRANYGKDGCCGGLAVGADRWEFTAPIKSFEPNPWGLYDTAGNVWEWTQDCYQGNYSEAPTDGSIVVGPEFCAKHPVRGGSWDSDRARLRSAARFAYISHSRGTSIGMRIALSF